MCGTCVDAMTAKYKEDLGDETEAAKRICMKFDIYWNERLFDVVRRSSMNGSMIRSYISKTNLYKYANKTYDDTISEEREAEAARLREAGLPDPNAPADEVPNPEDVEFWGEGFTVREYGTLNRKYAEWTKGLSDEDLTIGTVTLYRQICTLEIVIARNTAAGKPTESSISQLNNLLGSVNAKPIQKKNDEADANFDNLPFGVGIRMCENTQPIPKPLPQLEDVDGIVRYITIWFLGHLCKMLHIKNTYCKMYEEAIEKLRVDRPDLEDEDDESVFNNIFGDDQT